MRRFIAALVLVGGVLPGVAGAASIFEKVGTFDGQFLKLQVGARATAMGGAFVAVADDASALFWNAAGIARIDTDKSELSINHASWPADLGFDQIGYVFHLKKIPGAIGVQARALTMDPMTETTSFQPDPNVGTGNTFDAGMLAVGVGTPARSRTNSAPASRRASSTRAGGFSQQTYAFDPGFYDVGARHGSG